MTVGLALGALRSTLPVAEALAPTSTPTCDLTQTTCTFTPLPEPKKGKFDQAVVEKIDLTAYPLVPKIGNHILLWYREGLKHGNNIHVFSKVGDCLTATDNFLSPFSSGDYSLGDYASLEKVIKLVAGVPAHGPNVKAPDNADSFANPGLAATSGSVVSHIRISFRWYIQS